MVPRARSRIHNEKENFGLTAQSVLRLVAAYSCLIFTYLATGDRDSAGDWWISGSGALRIGQPIDFTGSVLSPQRLHCCLGGFGGACVEAGFN